MPEFKPESEYNSELMIYIGQAIKERREELEFSRQDLAEAVGVTRQMIFLYEEGKNRVTVESLQAIAVALRCETGHFFPKA